MKRTSLRLGAVSACVLAAALASPAYAAGTLATTEIKNTVTVNYNVGGVAQTSLSAEDKFVVDRKVNLTVTTLDSSTVSVSPGQTAAVTKFQVTNSSNATLDFSLLASQALANTAGAHSGTTDNFDTTNVKIYVDNPTTGTVGSYDAGDQLVTYLDELGPDASKTVFVVSDIPIGQKTGDAAVVYLTARAEEGGTGGSEGALVTQTATANVNSTVETVFADGAGAGDLARDGAYTAKDDYTVLGAALTVTKVSTVLSDPYTGVASSTVFPKMIPGAVVQYCITVKNASGGAAASGVSLSDTLPAGITYVAGSVKLNGTVAATGACNADGVTTGATYANGTVSGTINSVAAGDARTMVFQVTVNAN